MEESSGDDSFWLEIVPRKITVMYTKAHSLFHKMDELRMLVAQRIPDVFGVTET